MLDEPWLEACRCAFLSVCTFPEKAWRLLGVEVEILFICQEQQVW